MACFQARFTGYMNGRHAHFTCSLTSAAGCSSNRVLSHRLARPSKGSSGTFLSPPTHCFISWWVVCTSVSILSHSRMFVPKTAFKMRLNGRGVETKFCPGLHGLKWQLLLCFLATTCEAFFPGLVPITYCEEGNPSSYCKVRTGEGGQKRVLEGRGAEDAGWSQTHHLGMASYFFLVLFSQRLHDPSFALHSRCPSLLVHLGRWSSPGLLGLLRLHSVLALALRPTPF